MPAIEYAGDIETAEDRKRRYWRISEEAGEILAALPLAAPNDLHVKCWRLRSSWSAPPTGSFE
jgi:hypothetical protein